MESMKPKNGVRKEVVKAEFRSSIVGAKPFIANMLPCFAKVGLLVSYCR